jgi:hypothetical protein
VEQQANWYKLGYQRNLTLGVAHGTYRLENVVTEQHMPSGKPFGLDEVMENLPDDLRKDIRKEMNAMIQQLSRNTISPVTVPDKTKPPLGL